MIEGVLTTRDASLLKEQKLQWSAEEEAKYLPDVFKVRGLKGL